MGSSGSPEKQTGHDETAGQEEPVFNRLTPNRLFYLLPQGFAHDPTRLNQTGGRCGKVGVLRWNSCQFWRPAGSECQSPLQFLEEIRRGSFGVAPRRQVRVVGGNMRKNLRQ